MTTSDPMDPLTMNKEINIEYTTQIWVEDGHFIAYAMPIDVISSGSTVEEAREALDEAVQLFLKTAADMGTLDEILQESGYELKREGWVSPAWVAIERHSLKVMG